MSAQSSCREGLGPRRQSVQHRRAGPDHFGPTPRSWQLFGRPDSVPNRLYDWLRRRVNARLVRFLASHLPQAAADATAQPGVVRTRVLEAGSGTAFASSVFARRPEVDTSVCLDLNEEALRQAKNRDPTLPAVVGDLNRLPFADEAFALVYNSSTIEHLADPTSAVREMQRVCHRVGRVFVGVPYSFGPLAFQPLIRKTALGVWLGPVFNRASLERLMRSAGLSPVGHMRYFWNLFVGAVAAKETPRHAGGGRDTCGRQDTCGGPDTSSSRHALRQIETKP